MNLEWQENTKTERRVSAGVSKVGLTAGASAPEELVQGVVEKISKVRGAVVRNHDGVQENVVFKIPPQLADVPASAAMGD